MPGAPATETTLQTLVNETIAQKVALLASNADVATKVEAVRTQLVATTDPLGAVAASVHDVRVTLLASDAARSAQVEKVRLDLLGRGGHGTPPGHATRDYWTLVKEWATTRSWEGWNADERYAMWGAVGHP